VAKEQGDGVAPELRIMDALPPTCTFGHPLTAVGTSLDGWACDGQDLCGGCLSGCTGFYELDDVDRFTCEICSYDLCDKCAARCGYDNAAKRARPEESRGFHNDDLQRDDFADVAKKKIEDQKKKELGEELERRSDEQKEKLRLREVAAKQAEEAARKEREKAEQEARKLAKQKELEDLARLQNQMDKKKAGEEARRLAAERKAAADEEARLKAKSEWEQKQRKLEEDNKVNNPGVTIQVSSRGKSVVQDPKILAIIDGLQASKKQFEDPEFDPRNIKMMESFDLSNVGEDKERCWCRPKEWSPNVKLWDQSKGPTCNLHQGEVGNCWFISAMSVVVATDPEIIKQRFVASYPELGCFVLNFFKFGNWIEVIVDDRLLVSGGKFRGGYTDGNLVFCRNGGDEKTGNPSNEIWAAIMEKAYAKLHGGYANIDGGFYETGVSDLCGANPFRISKGMTASDLFKKVNANRDNGVKVLMGAGTPGTGEEKMSNGLVSGHAYGVLDLLKKENAPILCKIRNPWGADGEWNGAWSDKDKKNWTPGRKKEFEFTDENDGTFWMAFDQAMKVFDAISVTLVYPKSYTRLQTKGEWREANAGGCGNDSLENYFRKNPQYLITVPEPPTPGLKCHGYVGLSQEDGRFTHKKALIIGFKIYKAPPPGGKSGSKRIGLKNYTESLDTEYSSGTYTDAVTVSTIVDDMEPGKYVLIPTTFEPMELGRFMIESWTTYPIFFEELP